MSVLILCSICVFAQLTIRRVSLHIVSRRVDLNLHRKKHQDANDFSEQQHSWQTHARRRKMHYLHEVRRCWDLLPWLPGRVGFLRRGWRIVWTSWSFYLKRHERRGKATGSAVMIVLLAPWQCKLGLSTGPSSGFLQMRWENILMSAWWDWSFSFIAWDMDNFFHLKSNFSVFNPSFFL